MAITEACQHGMNPPSACFYCQHPAIGVAAVTFPGVPSGWKCPQCSRIYAPSVTECMNCVPATLTIGPSLCTCGTTSVCPVHVNVEQPRIICEASGG